MAAVSANEAARVICSPPLTATCPRRTEFTAAAKDNEYRITGMVAYANGQIVAQSSTSTLNASVPLSPGQYQLAWPAPGIPAATIFPRRRTSPSPLPAPRQAARDCTLVICSPVANSDVGSPVQISAAAKDNEYRITGMVAYANGKNVAQSNGGTLNSSVPLNPGQYQLVIRAWDSSNYLLRRRKTHQ